MTSIPPDGTPTSAASGTGPPSDQVDGGVATQAVPPGGMAAPAGAEGATMVATGAVGGSGSGSGSGLQNPEDDGPQAKPKKRRWLVEWGVILVIAVVVAVLVRTFVAQTFFIPSTSMYPTLKAGDRIVVNKLSFDYGSIQRGDIIVFKRPPKEDCGGAPVPDLVKRVIGLPGNTISAKGGDVYITGKEIAQPWLPTTTTQRIYTTTFGPVKVPKTQYFVMGDNRRDSCDSRIWGTVTRSLVVGKVDLLIWPLSAFRIF